jgi:hypothetical protein
VAPGVEQLLSKRVVRVGEGEEGVQEVVRGGAGAGLRSVARGSWRRGARRARRWTGGVSHLSRSKGRARRGTGHSTGDQDAVV